MKKFLILLMIFLNAQFLLSFHDYGLNKNCVYVDAKFSEIGFHDMWMRDVSFYDSLHGMIAGSGEYDYDPCLIKTDDGGYTWYPYWKYITEMVWDSVKKDSVRFYPQSIYKIQYLDTNSIFAITDNIYQVSTTKSYIMKSKDNGKNWDYTFLDSESCGYTIQMLNKKSGLSVASNALYSTNDSGNKWDKIRIKLLDSNNNDEFFIIDMSIVEDSVIYLCMMNVIWNKDHSHIIHFVPFLLKSDDNCKSWINYEFPDTNFRSICFTDRYTGFCSIQSYISDSTKKRKYYDRIYQTTDGGQSWFIKWESDKINLKRTSVVLKDGYPMSIKFFDKMHGIAYGYFSNLYLTSDGGNTWEDQVENFIPGSNIPAPFSSAGYAGSKDRIVVGTCLLGNTVLVFEPNRSSVTEDNQEQILTISPNPATDFLEISYSPSINRMVNHTVDGITIYDVFGEKLVSSSHYSILNTQRSSMFPVCRREFIS